MIFICTSSESKPESIYGAHGAFCNSVAPNPCGSQMGYPADEPLGTDHAHNAPYDGWSKWPDPIKTWGDGLLAAVSSATQEVSFVWVTVKPERIPWDLTKGAQIPSFIADPHRSRGRFLRERWGLDILGRRWGAGLAIFPTWESSPH